MGLELYTEKLPPELQESFKKDIASAVFVTSREEAKKILDENKFLNAEFQAHLSTKHEESLKKFNTEKLPVLIEEEIKKRGTKQPWEIEIEKLKSEAAEKDKLLTMKERKAQAQAELSKLGLDLNLADFFLIEDEGQFKEKISAFTGSATAWRDAEVKKVKESTYGQKAPNAGNSSPIDVESRYKKALESGNVAQAMILKQEMARITP